MIHQEAVTKFHDQRVNLSSHTVQIEAQTHYQFHPQMPMSLHAKQNSAQLDRVRQVNERKVQCQPGPTGPSANTLLASSTKRSVVSSDHRARS